MKYNRSIYYIQELNLRLFYTLIGTLLIFFTAYRYKQTLIFFILPKGASHIIATDMAEVITTYIYLCAILSAIGGAIVGIIQVYLFLRPGLYKFESNCALSFVYLSITLYVYAYLYVYPYIVQLSWEFFFFFTKSWSAIQLGFEPRLETYFQHAKTLATLIGISIPILLLLTLALTYTPQQLLFRHRRLIYLVALFFATLLTPPDLVSQQILALFLIGYCECYLFILVTLAGYKKILIG